MATIPHNEIRFPYNIFTPDDRTIDGENLKIYRAKFNNLYELYAYLTRNPEINYKVFDVLHSINGPTDFAGKPYEEAVQDLIAPPNEEFSSFLTLSSALDTDALGYVEEYKTINTPGGGHIDIPAYASGNPRCFKRSVPVYTPKFIRINIALSYYWGTSKQQVKNRASIIMALVNAFERAGYVVEINAFQVSREANEIIDIDVNIKGNSETFNKASLYKSLCYVEFLRRILFRVLETMSVTKDWGSGYGQTCDEKFVRKLRGFDEIDIFFDQPRNLNIYGDDIVEDFMAVLKLLKLEDKIDINQAIDNFNVENRRLTKTIR